MELYNEELTDLLSIDNDKDKRLRLLEDRSGVVVQGLEEVVVKSAAGAHRGGRGRAARSMPASRSGVTCACATVSGRTDAWILVVTGGGSSCPH